MYESYETKLRVAKRQKNQQTSKEMETKTKLAAPICFCFYFLFALFVFDFFLGFVFVACVSVVDCSKPNSAQRGWGWAKGQGPVLRTSLLIQSHIGSASHNVKLLVECLDTWHDNISMIYCHTYWQKCEQPDVNFLCSSILNPMAWISRFLSKSSLQKVVWPLKMVDRSAKNMTKSMKIVSKIEKSWKNR